jgi:hypothetical protein
MSFSRLHRRLPLSLAGLLALVLVVFTGCRPPDEIARYTVPKPEVIDPTLVAAAAEKRQMLGAIVIVERAGWFFKLTGGRPQIEPLVQPFESFVKSVRFEGSPPEPKWIVPPGWKELPGNEFRFATLEIPADGGAAGNSTSGNKALELTVTTLELGDTSEQEYLLANINRWRGQLGLSELSATDLANETVMAKVGEHPVTFINIVGTGSGAMPTGPFARGGGAAPLAPAIGPAAAELATGGKPKWTKPDGWTETPPKTFGIAAFTVGQSPKQVEITLSSAGGDWTANVNRWRGQVSLPRKQPDEIAKEAKEIGVLGVKGNYVQLTGVSSTTGQPMSLYGIAATVDGTQYFVKLTGEPELAESEKANFEAFAKSLKFE